ncbi:MAG TPA: FHA domain-containing protein [Burkholderiaceae bacterium]|nr:FHA domain-containing protein [Burkholderiaceae bacterium]
MNVHQNMAPDEALIAERRATADQQFAIVLKPLSHPELGDIRIDENVFAIGRTEAPFASYAPEIVSDLSRRHARIFSEYGAVYIADMDSKNGTTVNKVGVQQRITRLHDGDEICFGKALSYRVQLRARMERPAPKTRLISLTLTPERSDLGLQPIVITRFPFLISKADEAFSRYKDVFPQQVNYISRRHAHIFLKSDVPFVEDLGSTNGTFVAGNRLDEHAIALKEGDTIAFGGHHFVYKASLQKEEAVADPTVTKFSTLALGAVKNSADVDKTTFVAAADSFLDIFCVDQAQQQDDEVNDEASRSAGEAGKSTGKRAGKRKRGKYAAFLSELADSLVGGDRAGLRRGLRWGILSVALLGVLTFVLYHSGAPERELKALLASGEYAQAATLASQSLERDPDNAEIKAMGTEALLKANLPQWMARLNAHEFDRAAAILESMKKLSGHNADVQALVKELEWTGDLEHIVHVRGGADAPIQNPEDAARIKGILQQWDEDTQGHQRAFITISSYVPEFKDAYAEALSHLRKLALTGGRNGNQQQFP